MQSTRSYIRTLLLWSQKYTKTDMVYLARGSFWLGLGQIMASLATLAIAVTFANFLPADTYGAYKYILSIASIFALFTLPGLGIAFTRAVSKGKAGIVASLTRTRIKYSLLGTLIALVGSAYYLFNDNITLATGFFIIALSLPVFDTFKLYLSYFIGKRRFDLNTKYQVATQLISAVVLIGTIILTDNLVLILLSYFIPLSLTRFVFYWKAKRSIEQESKKSEEPLDDSETLRYGKHLTAINIVGTVASQIDKILLWKFFGATQLAIYAFALAVPEQIKGPLKQMGEIAFPKFATKTHDDVRKGLANFWYKITLYTLILTGLVTVYILSAPLIYEILFPQYIESVIYSQIFSLGLITASNTFCIKLLEAQKKTKVQYILQTGRPIVLIILFVTLIPIFGIVGAVVAVVTTRFLTMLSGVVALLFVFRDKHSQI